MNTRFASLVLTASLLALPGLAQAQGHGMHLFTPREMTWVNGPPSLPAGVKVAILEGNPAEAGPFTMRLWVPADTKAAPHFHSGIEHATIQPEENGLCKMAHAQTVFCTMEAHAHAGHSH